MNRQMEAAKEKQRNKKVYNIIKRNKSGPGGKEKGLGCRCIQRVVWEGLRSRGPLRKGWREGGEAVGTVFHRGKSKV